MKIVIGIIALVVLILSWDIAPNIWVQVILATALFIWYAMDQGKHVAKEMHKNDIGLSSDDRDTIIENKGKRNAIIIAVILMVILLVTVLNLK